MARSPTYPEVRPFVPIDAEVVEDGFPEGLQDPLLGQDMFDSIHICSGYLS